MRYWVGLTDRDWYDFLSAQGPLDEVDFWQPGAKKPVALQPGEPFLFKLHARHGGWIVGGGSWASFTTLPARMAWDYFGTANGGRVERPRRPYRRSLDATRSTADEPVMMTMAARKSATCSRR
jgi:putative restriction endonuclease